MGNLTSCVSCNSKDKNFKQSVSEFKTAASREADDVRQQPEGAEDGRGHAQALDVEEVVVSVPRVSGLDIYYVLKDNCIEPEPDEDKEDIEKAAKAIVDLTVFLATEVIYPAYLRYMQEDYPDEYLQYFERPLTPLPEDYDSEERLRLQDKASSDESVLSETVPGTKTSKGTPG